MARQEHLDLLRRDVDAWNQWRQSHPEAVPDLRDAELTGLDLAVANLAQALLTGANMALSNLRGADLSRADLSRASLVGARLLGVDLTGADLRGADLRTAEDLTAEQLEETLGDARTVLPEDISAPSNWAALRKVNLAEAFGTFSDHWHPKVAGDINDAQVKLVKLLGEFVWHHHEDEDELFLVIKGRFVMRLRDRAIRVEEGEFVIVPRGVEHQPVAEQECHVLLLEPRTTLNTGNVRNERTVEELERL